MSFLKRSPVSTIGKIHDISPADAKWSYVGFSVFKLTEGQSVSEATGDEEVILVVVEGKADISCNSQAFGVMGERMSVFERTPPHAVYIPNDESWHVQATTDCTIAVCKAPGHGGHPACRISDITLEERGQGSNLRYIYPIAMEDKDVADSLLVTEVFTPAGHWSSYPPHRHDEDDFPHMTYLEETYYHRLDPAQGFGIQRVFTEDGSLDETIAVSDHDVVLVPKGHHPCAAPYGYDLYYLNVMAGPLRKWRFKNHPDHDWLAPKT